MKNKITPVSPARRIALSSVLTAAALALSYAERLFPVTVLIPLPGVKLGLANIITMFALFFLGPVYSASILAARCMLSALFSGSAAALAMSLCGGFLALFSMSAAKRHVPRCFLPCSA